MAGFHLFSSRPYGELGEPSPGGEQLEFAAQLGWPEPSLSTWARTPDAEIETGVPCVHQKCPSTGRSRRRGSISLPRESHSLTHVARRQSDRSRKHRSGSLHLDEACGEAPTKSSRTWQQQKPQPDQPCPRYPAAPGGSSPPNPGGAYSPQSVRSLLFEKTVNGDRWAVPVSRHVGLWSPSSVLTDKSSVHSLEFRKQSTCVCTQKRGSGDRTESLTNQYSQPSTSCEETSSQHAQVLKSKLDEAVISSRDQKIVALVLSRLKKAQRMRELQQQAAVAWEELKRSDQKVHLTLERERRLLLQQSQEQWQGQKEPHKPRRDHEQLHQGHEQPGQRRDRQEKSPAQSESQSRWPVQLHNPENRDLDKLDGAHAQAEHLKQCQMQRLREQERVLQSLQDLNKLHLKKRLEAVYHRRQQHLAESQKKIQESNLSSVVNFQARKVLMDCQAKAEELLRKLSLEQSSQCSQDTQESLAKDRHREQQGKAQKEAEQFQRVRWRAEQAEERRQESKRVLAELAEQKIRQARCQAHKTSRDRAQHLQELNVLQERNHHITKLKAEKEEKSHIEGIKEAIKKKEQSVEQMTRRKDPIFQEFQKVPSTSKTDCCFDHMAAEVQLPMHQQSGMY
ncbi:coiled-coil domain-containing protein 185 [Phodopus roborovskii]|uniref:Ccdc185 protein n=1 Tax=Phodopus roborovskii TaxID=109678 RepID=A0AAU9ZBN8_PHORO|nr:coiled-coil domain-containing protein 185 [Phodopus roborovskii]CAH6789616.1 Ccdc185 [Phodopus roborovskii]